MSNRKIIAFVVQFALLIWFVPNVSYGQSKFSIDSIFSGTASDTLNVEQFNYSSWTYGGGSELCSNALTENHDYYPWYNTSLIRNDLGNIGSSEHLVLFDHLQPFGFNFRSARKGFWKNLGERKMLLSDKMFSNVHYVNGANRENYLVANLTRGFGQLLDMGFSFNRIVSEGIYDRQRNVITDLSFYSTFSSKDSRYKAAVFFDYLNLKAEENGGMSLDSVFENNLTSGRSFIPINLSAAENHWKRIDVGLEHRFVLTKDDSVRKRNYHPAISHSFDFGKHAMVYNDVPDTSIGFYENIFLDSTITYDSTDLLGVTNVLRFELLRSDSAEQKVLDRLAVGARHQYYQVAFDSIIEKLNNVSVLVNANGRLFKELNWGVSGDFMVYGNNLFDLKLNAVLDYRLGKSKFEGVLNYALYQPDHITSRYVSNHFSWNNSWNQTQHLRAGLRYEQQRWRFSGSLTYHLFDDLVVFGTDRLPFQSNSINQLLVLRLREHFKVRWFHLVLDGALQAKLTGDDIRVPLALGRGMLFYQNDLFKRKLRLQIGVEVNYSTAYYASAYNPALSVFHLQNDKQVGNYPFIDVFLNLRVKKFRAFFKVEHINAGWLGYRYYHVPHYAVNDLAWKFGVNWAFFD